MAIEIGKRTANICILQILSAINQAGNNIVIRLKVSGSFYSPLLNELKNSK